MIVKTFAGKNTSEFNPDNYPQFTHKQTLENGITTYWVEESDEGLNAVEDAFDACYRDECKRPWWVTGLNFDGGNKVRVAFQNNKIFAASWTDESGVRWWDLIEVNTTYLPNAFDAEGYNIEGDLLNALKDPLASKENLSKLDDIKPSEIDWRCKQSDAFNNRASLEVLEELAKSTDIYDRLAVASSKNAPVELLEILACDENNKVCLEALCNSNLPAESFVVPARCDHSNARGYVAYIRKTPVELLIELSEDVDDFVRKNVAENSSTPEAVLEKLSKDKYMWVRYAVAGNSHTSKEILERLMNNDPEEFVRDNAKKTLGIDEDFDDED